MRLTAKQALMLFDIAKDTLQIAGNWGGYSPDTRHKLVNEILNQQSNAVVDLQPETEKK